jgi:Flp pilus assembly protein TadG
VTRAHRSAPGARRARGQATIEFALCVIILLGTVLGLFDVGRAMLAQWAISEMAWVGGRFASRNLNTDPGIVSPGDALPNLTPGDALPSLSPGDALSSISHGGGPSTADIVAAARAAAFLLDPNAPTVTVEYPDGQPEPGRRVRVVIEYAYEPVSSQFIGGRTIRLSSANTLLLLR